MSKKKQNISEGLHADVMVVDEAASLEPVKIPEKKQYEYGIVTATMLNVREEPIATSNPIRILNKGDGVVISLDFISPDWFKITFESSPISKRIEGYVMKKFIKVLEQR